MGMMLKYKYHTLYVLYIPVVPRFLADVLICSRLSFLLLINAEVMFPGCANSLRNDPNCHNFNLHGQVT